MSREKMNTSKYQNAILYFIKYCNNQYLGATKLNKLLYYLDFISYRDRKKSVSGDSYLHLQYGPVPEHVDEILADLQKKKLLNIQRYSYKQNDTFNFRLEREPDMNAFDKYEKDLLENICKEFELWNTEKIVNQTHLEAPWFYSKPYEKVDYEYAKDIEFFIEPDVAV